MKNNKNLVFYYPLNDGAPSAVGRSIFENLLKKKDELPFNAISIFSPFKHKSIVESKFTDIPIFTERNILSIKNSIIHIPVSPLLLPNSKFLLQLYSMFGNNNLIFNYHGDIRTEVALNYKTNHKINYSYIPSCIFLPALLKSPDQLIVHSYLFKNLVLNKYGVTNAIVIPNGVEDYWYSSDYTPLPKNEGVTEIFYHGRLSAEKGVDILIKGFDKFLRGEKVHKALLYIAGDGPQKKFLEMMIQDLKLNQNVILLGNLDKSIIKGYLKKVDVAIYPSVWDNFPLSYIEAFASANCPVYFSKKAGIYDFVIRSKKQLYGFEPNIDTICKIISNVHKKEFNMEVLEQQKNFAIACNWDSVINDYIDVYSQIVLSNK